jgi:hypothetical protein
MDAELRVAKAASGCCSADAAQDALKTPALPTGYCSADAAQDYSF